MDTREPETVTLNIPLTKREWFTSNARLHWATKAQKTATLRRMGYYYARYHLGTLGAPIYTPTRPCRVCITVHLPTRRSFDPANTSPMVKALMDGMTDANVWSDDNFAVVREVTYKAGEKTEVKGLYRLELTITPVTPHKKGRN